MVDIISTYRKMVMSLLPDNLKKQLATEKGTLNEGIKNYLLASVVLVIVSIINMIIQTIIQSAYGGVVGAAAGFGALIIGAIFTIIIIPIVVVIITFISNGVMYLLAKLFGGQGTFDNHYYQFSIVGSGMMMVTMVLGLIPCVGSLAGFVLGLYFLYPVFLVYKEVHKLDNMKAGLLVAIPLLVMLLIVIGFLLIYGAALTALMTSMGGAGTLGSLPR